jgi:hypothetical protein
MLDLYEMAKSHYKPHWIFHLFGWWMLVSIVGSAVNVIYFAINGLDGFDKPMNDWSTLRVTVFVAAILLWSYMGILLKSLITYFDLLPFVIYGWIAPLEKDYFERNLGKVIDELSEAGRGSRRIYIPT